MSRQAIEAIIGNADIDRQFADKLVSGDHTTRSRILNGRGLNPEETEAILAAPHDSLHSLAEYLEKYLTQHHPEYRPDLPITPLKFDNQV